MRLAALLLLAACGAPADFSGKYTGILDWAGTCTTGARGYDTGSTSWLVVDDGAGNVSVATPGQCKSIKAVSKGTVADVIKGTCPLWPNGDVTLIEAGTLTLVGTKINVKIDTLSKLSSPPADCSAVFTGTLIR